MAEIKKQQMTYERADELIGILGEAMDVDGVRAVLGCVSDAIITRCTRFELGEPPVNVGARQDFFDAYAFLRIAHQILSDAQEHIERAEPKIPPR